RSRSLLGDRRRRHRGRAPVPDLRQRRHDDGDRPDHRHSLAVRQRRRLLVDREPRGDGRAARDPRAWPRAVLLVSPLVVHSLSARVPLLRTAVIDQLVASFARKNGIVAAAVWTPGADLPLLALNEVRLLLRLAQAHGTARDVRDRLPELAAVLGAGFGLRALARELLGLVPGAGWVVKAGVAYAGTRALGEAARLRFALAPTQQLGGAARAAP